MKLVEKVVRTLTTRSVSLAAGWISLDEPRYESGLSAIPNLFSPRGFCRDDSSLAIWASRLSSSLAFSSRSLISSGHNSSTNWQRIDIDLDSTRHETLPIRKDHTTPRQCASLYLWHLTGPISREETARNGPGLQLTQTPGPSIARFSQIGVPSYRNQMVKYPVALR